MREQRFNIMPYSVSILILLITLTPGVSWGVLSIGSDIELEGFFEAKNLLRTPKFQDAELVMQRNTVQLEGKWYFLRESKAFRSLSTGWLEEGTISTIGRGVYDSIYDVRSSFRDRFSSEERDDRRLEYKLREIYADLVLPPMTFRIGKQQVVWGETDQFRALDVINPLDFRWRWAQENWEDIRIPLWMVRGIYDIGKLGFLEESFVEGIWIPGDFKSNKVSADPRQPWGIFGQGVPARSNTVLMGGQILDLTPILRSSKPDSNLRSSEFAFRLKGIWGGLDFSLNYFWTLSDNTGFKTRSDLARVDASSVMGGSQGTLVLPIDLVNPRSHVVGVSANYSEEEYTQSVFRIESAYTTGIPVRIDPGAPTQLDPDGNGFDSAERTLLMLAFDRPTWFRPLNRIRTFFLSGQIFWQRYIDYNRSFRGAPSVRRARVGGSVLPGRFVGVNTDRLTEDEVVATLSASTSYGPGAIWSPLVALAYDPLAAAGFSRIQLDYLYTDHILFKLQQDVYWGRVGEGPWFIGGRFGRSGDSRHETLFSATFQF